MRRTYLLDENVFHQAVSGTDETGNPSYDALTLIHAIADICHKICADEVVLEKYRATLQKLEKKANLLPYPGAIKVLRGMLASSQKLALVNDPVRTPFDVPADDLAFVQVAATRKPVFVTNDHRLAARIEAEGISAKNGFTVLDAKKAAQQAISDR